MTIIQEIDALIAKATAETEAWSSSLDGWEGAEQIAGQGVYAASDKHVRITGDVLSELFARMALGDAPMFDRPAPTLQEAAAPVPSIADNAPPVVSIALLAVAKPTFSAEDNVGWIAAHRANVVQAISALEQARERRDQIAAVLGV